MRAEAVRYAIYRYKEIRSELGSLLDLVGHDALACIVRQKGSPDDTVWRCQEIGIDSNSGAFWATFYEGDPTNLKKITAVFDIETIMSIEFEVFDEHPEERNV